MGNNCSCVGYSSIITAWFIQIFIFTLLIGNFADSMLITFDPDQLIIPGLFMDI